MVEPVASVDKLLLGCREARDPQLKITVLLQELIITRLFSHKRNGLSVNYIECCSVVVVNVFAA
jgi:hypothetical protein